MQSFDLAKTIRFALNWVTDDQDLLILGGSPAELHPGRRTSEEELEGQNRSHGLNIQYCEVLRACCVLLLSRSMQSISHLYSHLNSYFIFSESSSVFSLMAIMT